MLRTRRVGEPRKKSSYQVLVEKVYSLMIKAKSIPEYIGEYKEGTIVFTRKPRLPFLVYTKISSVMCIVDKVNARLESISINRTPRVDLMLRVLIDDNKAYLYCSSLNDVLAYLFLPEVLREYHSGYVEIVSSEPGFQDFIDIIVEYGEDLASKYTELLGSENESSRRHIRRIRVLKQYPGINFSFIGVEYDDHYGDIYLVACDKDIEEVFKACIGCEDPDPHIYSMSRRHVSYLPVFNEIIEFVGKRSVSILDEYKRLAMKAYLGLKAYEV